MDKGKFLILIGIMLIVFALFYFVVIPAENQLLDSLVSTGPDITLDAWLGVFQDWAKFGLFIALFMAMLWYTLGQWFFSLNHWTDANRKKRWVWVVLLAISVLAAVPGDLLLPRLQEWGRLATALYVVNNFLVYYLVTLIWSPSSVKYMPLGAAKLRYW